MCIRDSTQTEGTELRQWAPDGTLSTVKDILPGSEGSSPSNLTVDGGRLLFSADDGVHGDEIWQLSDPGPATAVTIRILGRRATVGKQGFAAIRLACPADETSGPCMVKLTVKTARPVRVKGKVRKVTVSKKTVTVATGTTGTAKLKISKPVLDLLRRSGKARKVKVTAVVSDKAGNRRTVKKAFRLGKPAK